MNLKFTNYQIEELEDDMFVISLPFKDNYHHFVSTGTFGNLVSDIPDLTFVSFELENGVLRLTVQKTK